MEHVKGFQDLTKVDDALRTFLDVLGEPSVRADVIPVQDALERFLASDVIARRYLPPIDVSIMDGYAVLSEDVQNASEQSPVILTVTGESKLGSVCRLKVRTGQAVAVATGSMVPAGADSIAIIEQTKSLASNKVAVQTPTSKGQNILKKGEDIASGQIVLPKGRRLRPEDVGVLRALGIVKVQVARKQRVAIISTGNELASSPSKNDPAKVVDTNRPILSAMIRSIGAQPVDLGIVKDNEQGITAALKTGIRTADVVLVSAGSSVGKRDLVPRCIDGLGKPGMLVHGIAMRPAMPTGLAIVKGKPVVSLPGFPISAMIAFRVFVRPLVAKLSGVPEMFDPTVKAVLKERISGGRGLRTFVRVVVRREQGRLVAEPLRTQRSSVLTSMINANGIVTIPETNMVYEAGEEMEVSLIGEISSNGP
jgi:molybdopterin molybdotransferase